MLCTASALYMLRPKHPSADSDSFDSLPETMYLSTLMLTGQVGNNLEERKEGHAHARTQSHTTCTHKQRNGEIYCFLKHPGWNSPSSFLTQSLFYFFCPPRWRPAAQGAPKGDLPWYTKVSKLMDTSVLPSGLPFPCRIISSGETKEWAD